MPGRYAQLREWSEILGQLVPDYEKTGAHLPPLSDNVSPGENICVVAYRGKPVVKVVRWGMITEWALRSGFNLINIRSETLLEKKTFADIVDTGRCLIPATAYYEWKAIGARKKPYRIRMKNAGFFTFAGLWTTYNSPSGESTTIESCAIITTVPNAVVAPLHDRMGVIIPEKLRTEWLSGSRVPLADFLHSYPADEMIAEPFDGDLRKKP